MEFLFINLPNFNYYFYKIIFDVPLLLALLQQLSQLECAIELKVGKDEASFSRNIRTSMKATRRRESSFPLNEKFSNHISYLGNLYCIQCFRVKNKKRVNKGLRFYLLLLISGCNFLIKRIPKRNHFFYPGKRVTFSDKFVSEN